MSQADGIGTLTPGLNLLGAEAIFEPLPPVEWLCEPLRIAPGAPTLFAGYGYSGKSVALQSLALSVASGLPLWGKWPVKRGRVLHLDYEQGRRITSERYQRMVYAEGMDPRFLRETLEAAILPSVSLTPELLLHLGDSRVLVLVDSWRAAHPGVDENSSEVRRTLDAMGLASERTGCVFVVLHHSRKPQKDSPGGSKMSIRGSSGFFDGCQTIYTFDGEDVGAPKVLLEKDRILGSKLQPFVLRIVDTKEGVGLQVRAEAATAPVIDRSADFAAAGETLLKALQKHPGTNGNTLAELTGIRRSTVTASLSILLASGQIVQLGKASATRLYLCGMEPKVPF